jgi:hypothetical protein
MAKKKIAFTIWQDFENGGLDMEVKNHTVTPEWTAAVLYMIFNRYLQAVPDNRQNEFVKETMNTFNWLFKDQIGYTLMKLDEADENHRRKNE